MQSGVSLSPWAMSYPGSDPRPRDMARRVASRLGGAVADSSGLVACFRTKPSSAIVNASMDEQAAVRE